MRRNSYKAAVIFPAFRDQTPQTSRIRSLSYSSQSPPTHFLQDFNLNHHHQDVLLQADPYCGYRPPVRQRWRSGRLKDRKPRNSGVLRRQVQLRQGFLRLRTLWWM
ncbi:hypothetical protein RB213_011964 [Colletotrichum asianum]|uniref:Uncharacterized protein n=1 Tax=Colletotrichum asianum TaxID=702518 RepID=A0A8H3W7V1_9PEZI|nr:hypothetical protein GQ607_013039 [Colletotrichum asianum]